METEIIYVWPFLHFCKTVSPKKEQSNYEKVIYKTVIYIVLRFIQKIHVGFTTTDPKGFLIGAYSDISKEYLTLMVSNSGHLRLVFDFGFERQEMVFTDQNFLTGQFHDVRIERFDHGRQLMFVVDNYEPKIFNFQESLKSSADAQFNSIQYLYIGKNESMREGFVGCISRVEFDEIIPLKLLFQEDPLANIKAYPETITEDFCGIEPVTLPPEEEETRRPPDVDEEKIEHLYHTTNSAILGAVLALIFVGLIIVALLIGKYKNRHKGEYITREDEGAHDAFDADTAVLQGRTGHQVEKKKEWFIQNKNNLMKNLYYYSLLIFKIHSKIELYVF